MLDQTVEALSELSAQIETLLLRKPKAKGVLLGSDVSIEMVMAKARSDWAQFKMMINDTEAELTVDPDVLPHLLKAAGYSPAGKSWPFQTRTLVIAHLIAQHVEELARQLDWDVSLRPHFGPGPVEQSKPHVGLALTSDLLEGQTTILRLAAHEDVLLALGDAMAPPAQDVEADEAHTGSRILSLRSAPLAMPRPEFRVLAEGDVILTDQQIGLDQEIVVWMDAAKAANAVSSDAGGYVLQDDFADRAARDTDRQTALGDEEVLITFEFGRCEVPADDVGFLGADAEIPAPKGDGNWVTVLVDGATFATGSIVTCHDANGVRLSKIG